MQFHTLNELKVRKTPKKSFKGKTNNTYYSESYWKAKEG